MEEENSKGPSPCSNWEYIQNFTGNNVTLIGKISSIKNNTIYINMNPSKKII